MIPVFHLASTIIVMPFASSYFSYQALAGFFLSASFLDIDHYFFYLFKFKQFSLKKAWLFYQSIKHKPRQAFCLFHTIEFLILIILLAYFSQLEFFKGVVFGLSYHLLIDLVQAIYYHEVNYRFWSLWHYLLIYNSP